MLKKLNFNLIFLATLSGVLLGFSFPPFEWGWISFFSLIPLLILSDKFTSKLQVVRYSYFLFLIFHVITIFWIGGWEAKTDVFMMLGSVGLILIHPFFYVLIVSLFIYIKKHLSDKFALFAFPFIWVMIEYFRSIDETAFPWLTIGNSLTYNLSLIQISNIIGVWGLSFIIVVINVLFYVAIKNLRNKQYRYSLNKISIILIILLFQFIYGKLIINENYSSGDEIKIGVVQPNLDPWDKWSSLQLDTLISKYLNMTDSCINKGAELVIWPETALPVYLLNNRYTSEVDRIHKYIDSNNIRILSGLPLFKIFERSEKIPYDAKIGFDSSYFYKTYNGTVLFEPFSRNYQWYGKIKLVPFSERSPYLEYIPFLGKIINWSVGIGNWNVGDNKYVFSFQRDENDSVKFSALICYESVFPGFNADFIKSGAQFIVVVTNDSWFGELSGPQQHKQIATLRAVENRRWVIRAANGGISCLIDPVGKKYFETPLNKETYFVGSVFLENEFTYYTKYQDIICYISILMTIVIFIISFISKRIKTKNEGNRSTK